MDNNSKQPALEDYEGCSEVKVVPRDLDNIEEFMDLFSKPSLNWHFCSELK